MSYAVDVNVLLYASDASSPFHEKASAAVIELANGPEIVYLFWPIVMAYLRISTHPAIFTRPLTMDEAMKNMDQLLSRAHIQSPGEQVGFWAKYREVAVDSIPSGNLVPDAHIVGLMLQNDVRTIWTHDRDYRRFKGIHARDPFE